MRETGGRRRSSGRQESGGRQMKDEAAGSKYSQKNSGPPGRVLSPFGRTAVFINMIFLRLDFLQNKLQQPDHKQMGRIVNIEKPL